MEKLREYINKWINGENVRGIHVTPYTINECIYIYNSIAAGNKPEFINEFVKMILDKCNIETKEEGVGWRVV